MAILGILAKSCVISYPCHWESQVLGSIFFRFYPSSLFLLVYVSTLTSLAIAVDRYFVIVHPFRSRMRLGVCILLIIVIWIVGISISLPLAIYMRFENGKCEVSRKRKSKLFEKFRWVLLRNIGLNIHLDVSLTFHL